MGSGTVVFDHRAPSDNLRLPDVLLHGRIRHCHEKRETRVIRGEANLAETVDEMKRLNGGTGMSAKPEL